MEWQKKIYLGMALVAAGVSGYCLHPVANDSQDVDKNLAPESKAKPKVVVVDNGDAAKVVALRRQVRDLEAQLAECRKNANVAESDVRPRVEVSRSDRPSPPGFPGKAWLEEMKKRDPERFARMTDRLSKMRQERKSRQEAKATYLSSVNTSNMSAEDRDTHEEYQELLARREALEEQMHQAEITDEARHELMGEMREIDHRMRTLGESERKVLLNEVVKSMGMDQDSATELIETVSDVFAVTEAGGPPGPPPGAARP